MTNGHNSVSYRNVYNTNHMKPRKVEIPVEGFIRDQIRTMKGNKSYDNFFIEKFGLEIEKVTKQTGWNKYWKKKLHKKKRQIQGGI